MIVSSIKISLLLPIENQNIKFYNNFALQYSILISSNLLIYGLIEEICEEKIFELFQSYHASFNEYSDLNNILPAMGLQLKVPQQEEPRGLFLDKFFIEMANKKYSPKQLLLYYINLKEFVVLYSLFEGILKEEFIKCNLFDENKFLKEKDIIKYIKQKYKDDLDKFDDVLRDRSFYDINSIEKWWNFYTNFRHLIFHNGAKVTDKWKNNYDNLRNNLCDLMPEEQALEVIDILDNLDEIDDNIKIDEYFFITDRFINMFRDFIVNLIEAMYLLDIQKDLSSD